MATKDSEMIFGLRAVIEALEAGQELDKIFVRRESRSDLMQTLLAAVGERSIPIRKVPVEKLDRLTRKNHQGVIAFKAATTYYRLHEVVPVLYEEGLDPFIVVLDGVTDVRNFGAIARTCECAAVDAIVIAEQNAVSVNGDAIKTSAGALSRIAVCRERTIGDILHYLKDSGVRIVGATEKSNLSYTKGDYKGPLAIVLGAEDTGLSPLTMELADELVSIPLLGDIGSLNVSVAGGIVMYEAVRQRSK